MARYTLILEPIPGDGRPDAVRLKQALKYLGRACRLRCVGIRPETSANEKQAAFPSKENGCPEEFGDTDDTSQPDR